MKKKLFQKSKGMKFLFTLAILFTTLVTALTIAVLLTTGEKYHLKKTPKYGQDFSRQTMVVEILDISNRIATAEDKLSALYLIATDSKLIVLEADIKDNEINEAAEHPERLLEKSLYRVVQVTPMQDGVLNLLKSLETTADLSEVERVEFLSSYLHEQDEKNLYYGMMILWVFPVAMLFIACKRYRRNKKDYDNLQMEYAELAEDINLLEIEADYIDYDLGIAIYKEYVVFFAKSFTAINIMEIKKIDYILHSFYFFFFPIKKYYFMVKTKDKKKKTCDFNAVKYGMEDKMKEIFAAILKVNPDIEI